VLSAYLSFLREMFHAFFRPSIHNLRLSVLLPFQR
jgi:hypothetical protein